MTAATGSDPDRTITLDAHVHTDASHDCSTSPEHVVSAALDAGLDAVAVTDHDAVDGARRAVVPHPFQFSRHGVRKAALGDCDGVEVLNAVAVTGAGNRRARRFAAAADYPAIGGSDAHVPDLIGRAFTAVELPDGADWRSMTVDDLLGGIRADDVTARGTVTTPPEFARTYAWHARSTAATAIDSARTAATAGSTALGSRVGVDVRSATARGLPLRFGARAR